MAREETGEMRNIFPKTAICKIGQCVLAFVLMAVVCLCDSAFTASPVLAEEREPKPSVLVVDSNIGDLQELTRHWLGNDVDVVAQDGSYQLFSISKTSPVWWAKKEGADEVPAPRTFVLGVTDANAPLGSSNIAWALDKIRESGAEPRTFVLAMGTTGLALREYAEDLGAQKQSSRADLVGLGFCGTPHNGYSVLQKYPELTMWNTLAGSVGLTADDLVPSSDYLKKLNGGVFPAVTKTLQVSGVAGDLGFGPTDGAAVIGDTFVPTTLTSQIMPHQATATIGANINLSNQWMPVTSSINYPGRSVDKSFAERMSAIETYEASAEVQSQVREFYDSWFADGSPVTHNASVLALDLSGSMLEEIEPGMTKLDAAKAAAKEYLHAIDACVDLPQVCPTSVSVTAFSETLNKVATTYDSTATSAVDAIQVPARDETNIGIALEDAVSTLKTAPTCAKKHVLLLSDGAATRGMSNEQMLAGPVAEAKKLGIAIDVVGFGDVGESNAQFLRTVAQNTGGTYYEAKDPFELKVDFVDSYYNSLGLEMVDEDLPAQSANTKLLGNVGDRTSALMLGIVAEGSDPQVGLTCGGNAIDPNQYKLRTESGLTSLQYSNPALGDYEVNLSGHSKRLHVFAVKQLGISSGRAVDGEQLDISLYLLIGAGVLMVAGLATVIVVSVRKRK